MVSAPASQHRRLSTGVSAPASVRGILLLLLVSWLLVASAYSGAVSTTSGITGMDFASFYTAAQRLNAGHPLYQPHLNPALGGSLYVYSPLLALLMRPLAHISFHTATKAWFFVNAASLILAVLLYGLAARISWRKSSLLAILLLVSFRFWDTTMNFGLGQSNSLMLVLIAAMLWADSRERWWLMGALIALAALFKVWLIGLVLYLLLRRRWQEAAFGIGAFLVALGGLFSIVGWPELPSYLHCMVQAKAFGEKHAVMNSIVGVRGSAPADESDCIPACQQSIRLRSLCRRLCSGSYLGICGDMASSAEPDAAASPPVVRPGSGFHFAAAAVLRKRLFGLLLSAALDPAGVARRRREALAPGFPLDAGGRNHLLLDLEPELAGLCAVSSCLPAWPALVDRFHELLRHGVYLGNRFVLPASTDFIVSRQIGPRGLCQAKVRT